MKTRKPAEKSMETSSQSISLLLQRWSDGDSGALEQLMPLVYGELRRMARRYMGQQPSSHTLQATALIHEAYLRLVGQEERTLGEPRSFLRRCRAGHAPHPCGLRPCAAKRGGEARTVSLEEAAIVSKERAAELEGWTMPSRNWPGFRPGKAGWLNCAISAV